MSGTKKRRKRRMQKPHAYRKACWYLGRGYPPSFIAWKLGVNRNSVMTWARRAGISDKVVRLAKRIQKLTDAQRAQLLAPYLKGAAS